MTDMDELFILENEQEYEGMSSVDTSSLPIKTLESVCESIKRSKQIENIFDIESRDSKSKEGGNIPHSVLKNSKLNKKFNIIDENVSVRSYITNNTNKLFNNGTPKSKAINYVFHKESNKSIKLKPNQITANPSLNNEIISNQYKLKSMSNFKDFLKMQHKAGQEEINKSLDHKDSFTVNLIVNVQNININNNNKYITTSNNNNNTIQKTQINSDQNFLNSNFRKSANNKTILTPKQRFRILYLKIQIVLLFKYILRYVKFIGVNMLSVDIKKEMQIIEKMDLGTLIVPLPKLKSKIDLMYSINPNSKFVATWNFITLSLLVYTSTILPYNVCFGDTTVIFTGLWYIELLFDILFITDLILNFFIGYYDDYNDRLIMTNKEIAKNYLQSWFLIDFVSTFPFNYIEYGMSSNQAMNQNNRINKLIRLTKLPRLHKIIKLFRFLRFLKFFKKNALFSYVANIVKMSNGVKRILMAASLMLLLCHLFACIYHFSAKFSDYEENTWVYRINLIDKSDTKKYFTAFYYSIVTMTAIGFGDIPAYTLTEKAITLLMCLCGIAFYSFGIANLSIVISNMHSETVNLHLKLKTLNDFAKKVPIKNDTYIRITQIFEHDLHHHISYNFDKFLEEIPMKLRVELLFQLNESFIRITRFFYNKTPNFVADIVDKWKRIDFQKKTYIYFEGELPYDIYFIKKGSAVYLDDEGNDIYRFKKGALLGEIEPFLTVNNYCYFNSYM